MRVYPRAVNQGKGAALRTGFAAATGDIVIVQDADLEYDPQEYPRCSQPILDGKADVVFGSRFLGGEPHRVLYFWHSRGQQVPHAALEHVHQPQPHRHGDLLQGLPPRGHPADHDRGGPLRLRAGDHRQGRAPPAAASTRSASPTTGRTYEEGKKIGWKDGVRAIWCILKYNLFR